jgi:hypothetical protein
VASLTARPLYPREIDPVPIVQGGWVGPRAGLDGCGKSRPPPGFDPRTAQPIASRRLGYAGKWDISTSKYVWPLLPF